MFFEKLRNGTKKSAIKLSHDAFSDSQLASKLWLCREIEKIFHNQKALNIWILGGWFGGLAFLLFCRERLDIKSICSFDLNPIHTKQAKIVNENWLKENKFKAETMDCNKLNYTPFSFNDWAEPDLIINTSVEHFYSKKWFFNIPEGKKVVLQSNDLKIKEHVSCTYSEDEFKKSFPLQKIDYSGSLKFDYIAHSFSRFMLIGKK